SKNEKNVAFAIPLRFLGALSTAHACKAGWTEPKPRPYSAPATSIIGIFGSQDKRSIAININMVPGGITYISPFLWYIILSVLLFFITLTFGCISSFLSLYAVVRGIIVIQFYFSSFALFLIMSGAFGGRM